MGGVNDGHRQRMKDRFEKFGLDAFQDHEVLELLLFYGLPYKNTNGMAHELINRFGSFSGVFSASKEELKKVKGIGEHAATLIRMIPQLFRRYSADAVSKHFSVSDRDTLKEYVINHFIGSTTEHVQLFLFDSGLHRIDSIKLADGNFTDVTVTSERIAEHVFANRASYYIIAHNHPSGDTKPTREDLIATRNIWLALGALNREMIEHYVVSGGKCNGILTEAKEMFDK